MSQPPFFGTTGNFLPLDWLTTPIAPLDDIPGADIARDQISALSEHEFTIRIAGSYTSAWTCDDTTESLTISFDFTARLKIDRISCLHLCPAAVPIDLTANQISISPATASGHWTFTDGGTTQEADLSFFPEIDSFHISLAKPDGVQAQIAFAITITFSAPTGATESDVPVVIENAQAEIQITTDPGGFGDCPDGADDVTNDCEEGTGSILGATIQWRSISPTTAVVCTPGGSVSHTITTVEIADA